MILHPNDGINTGLRVNLTDPTDQVLTFLELLIGENSSTDDPNDCARPALVEVFSQGNCGRLAVLLARIFVDGQVVQAKHNCHYAYQRGGYVYDIHGRRAFLAEQFRPMDWGDHIRLCELAECMDNYSFSLRGPMI